MSLWLRRLFWLIAGVGVLGLASWALVPPILKNQLEKHVSAQLGRAFTVGKIDFKPWTLELELTDLALAQAGGGAAQLALKHL